MFTCAIFYHSYSWGLFSITHASAGDSLSVVAASPPVLSTMSGETIPYLCSLHPVGILNVGGGVLRSCFDATDVLHRDKPCLYVPIYYSYGQHIYNRLKIRKIQA